MAQWFERSYGLDDVKPFETKRRKNRCAAGPYRMRKSARNASAGGDAISVAHRVRTHETYRNAVPHRDGIARGRRPKDLLRTRDRPRTHVSRLRTRLIRNDGNSNNSGVTCATSTDPKSIRSFVNRKPTRRFTKPITVVSYQRDKCAQVCTNSIADVDAVCDRYA